MLDLLTGGGFALLATWHSQADANPMFINLKPQTAVFVILNQLTEIWTGGGIGGQAPFEFCIEGVDFSGADAFVEMRFCKFSFLLGNIFHSSFLSLIQYLGSRAGK